MGSKLQRMISTKIYRRTCIGGASGRSPPSTVSRILRCCRPTAARARIHAFNMRLGQLAHDVEAFDSTMVLRRVVPRHRVEDGRIRARAARPLARPSARLLMGLCGTCCCLLVRAGELAISCDLRCKHSRSELTLLMQKEGQLLLPLASPGRRGPGWW